MKHADVIIERILFLEGVPNLQRFTSCSVGETVKEQLESDLALEYAAITSLNQGSPRRARWATTAPRTCSRKILVGEEEHADWLETQLELIAPARRAELPRAAARGVTAALPGWQRAGWGGAGVAHRRGLNRRKCPPRRGPVAWHHP